jgi:hypothetical protein
MTSNLARAVVNIAVNSAVSSCDSELKSINDALKKLDREKTELLRRKAVVEGKLRSRKKDKMSIAVYKML